MITGTTSSGALESPQPPTPVIIRPLQAHSEFVECIRLQKETWGQSFTELVPIAILKATSRIGGVIAGAFDDENRMIGFVFGMTGLKNGRPVHWSDMLAVRREARDSGLGRRLKEYQRDTVRDLGVDEIYWTYDPLVAKNAYLNLSKLGAVPVEYVPEMYGGETDSDLHRGVGTDRFVVCWRPSAARSDVPSAEADQPNRVLGSPILNPLDPRGAPTIRSEVDYAVEPYLRVQIPLEIQEVQATSAELAWKWRETTREAFLTSFSLGYVVTRFYRGAASGHCYYVLERQGEP